MLTLHSITAEERLKPRTRQQNGYKLPHIFFIHRCLLDGQDAGDAEINDIFRAAPSPHLRSLGRGTVKVGDNRAEQAEQRQSRGCSRGDPAPWVRMDAMISHCDFYLHFFD